MNNIVIIYYLIKQSMVYSKEIIQKYIEQLSVKEKQTLKIAQEHLGSSFNLVKSIGFQNWIKKNSK